MKKGLFPGSFDPFTKGHEAIVLKAINLFDEIIIGIGENLDKKYMFSSKERFDFVSKTLKTLSAATIPIWSVLNLLAI